MHAAFKSVFPYQLFSNALPNTWYRLGDPAFDVRNAYGACDLCVPLRVKVRLIIFGIVKSFQQGDKDIKGAGIYMGENPLMTENGTFRIMY